MKVLYLSGELYPPKPCSRNHINLKFAETLVASGHDVTVSAPIEMGYAELKRAEAERGLRLRPYSPLPADAAGFKGALYRLGYSLLSFWNVMRLVVSERYDAVHVADVMLAPAALATKLVRGGFYCLSAHDIVASRLYGMAMMPSLAADMAYKLERTIPRFFDLVFAASNQYRLALIAEGCHPSRIHVTGAGVESGFFGAADVEDSVVGELKEKYGIEQKLVLCNFPLDPLSEPKLRDIVKKVAARRPDVTFVVYGEGKVYERLRSQLESVQARFPGPLRHRDIPANARAANAGLIIYETQPQGDCLPPPMLLEYLSAGLPVVSTDVPCLRDIFGFHDFIKVSNSTPELARDVAELVDSGRSEAAAGLVKERFDWLKITSPMVDEMARRARKVT